METSYKNKLINLGADQLAESLLKLSKISKEAHEMVENLIASPDEKIQIFKSKITKLKRSRRFIRWGESSGFANTLEILLMNLKDSISDPLTGVKLIIDFYKADNGILGNCDDSSGYVGDIFRETANNIFIEYASQCSEKKKIADMLVNLNKKNDYGVRDILIDSCSQFLPEKNIRNMIEKFRKLADKKNDENDEFDINSFSLNMQSLARQIKDPELFISTKKKYSKKLSTAGIIEIAEVYLESKETEKAHSWLKKIPENETYMSHKKDKLLLEISRNTGDESTEIELLHKNFKENHTVGTFNELLKVIGENKYEEVISKEMKNIFDNLFFNHGDVNFLLEIGQLDKAELYIFKNADKINGLYYESLLPLAKELESQKSYLTLSIIYRALLDSILERARSTIYPHGVRYLKKLDKISPLVTDWKEFSTHETYKKEVLLKHRLKRSFWSKYNS